jgi:hypothetical protein
MSPVNFRTVIFPGNEHPDKHMYSILFTVFQIRNVLMWIHPDRRFAKPLTQEKTLTEEIVS